MLGLWDPSSPTRDRTWALDSESPQPYPLLSGKSPDSILISCPSLSSKRIFFPTQLVPHGESTGNAKSSLSLEVCLEKLQRIKLTAKTLQHPWWWKLHLCIQQTMGEEVYILLLLLSLLPSGLFYLKQERQKRSCISWRVHVVLDTFNKNINDRK